MSLPAAHLVNHRMTRIPPCQSCGVNHRYELPTIEVVLGSIKLWLCLHCADHLAGMLYASVKAGVVEGHTNAFEVTHDGVPPALDPHPEGLCGVDLLGKSWGMEAMVALLSGVPDYKTFDDAARLIRVVRKER